MTKTQQAAAEMEAALDAQQARYRANDPEFPKARQARQLPWGEIETQDVGRN